MRRDVHEGCQVGAAHYNAPVRVHSSAPTRIDLAGGTLDIWPLYLFHDDAQTVNAAITVRAECTLSPSRDGRLHIVAADTGAAIDVADWSELDDRVELRLVTRVLRFFRPSNVTIETRSGAPVGAGLAGSSALNIALCGALARWLDRSFEPEALIALALNLEAQVLGVPTGLQDYRPAMYGGIAAIEMGPGGVARVPLEVDPHELGRRLNPRLHRAISRFGYQQLGGHQAASRRRPRCHRAVRGDPRRGGWYARGAAGG